MSHRRAAKVDNNQADIVKALRKIPGVTVSLGHDDLLVGYRSVTYWFEVKMPDQVSKKTGTVRPSAKQPSQKRIESEWRGHYRIVWSVGQILEDIGIG